MCVCGGGGRGGGRGGGSLRGGVGALFMALSCLWLHLRWQPLRAAEVADLKVGGLITLALLIA